MTREVPYAEIKGYPPVIMAIHAAVRPARPGLDVTKRGLTDSLWAVLQRCWAQERDDRPTSSDVLQSIEEIIAHETSEAARSYD